MVDGVVMNLGACCSKYGKPLDQPNTAGNVEQGLQRRAARQQSKSVYTEDQWDLVENFGRVIRQAREKKKIPKDVLGGRVAATVPQLNQIEAGTLRPSDKVAKALERELGITLLEKADNSAIPAQKKSDGKGLTIGDLLKDAMDK